MRAFLRPRGGGRFPPPGGTRPAFSAVELIVVVVLVALLTTLASRRLRDSDLELAADRLLAHLLLTRSLALSEEQFLPSTLASEYADNFPQAQADVRDWRKKFWRIQFHNLTTTHGQTYSIYSERPTSGGAFNNNPAGLSRIARDPLSGKCLTYGSDSYTPAACRENREESLKLQQYYKLSSITLNSPCGSNKRSETFLFDSFGAPYCGANPLKLASRAEIVLAKGSRSLTLCIEAVTGYAHVCGRRG